MTTDINLVGATVTRANVYLATFPALTNADLPALYAAAANRRARIDAAYRTLMGTPEGLRFRAIDEQYRDVLRRRDRVAGNPRYNGAFDRHQAMLYTLSREWDFAREAFEPLYDAYRALVDDIVNDRA
jgi:hypothetical protein